MTNPTWKREQAERKRKLAAKKKTITAVRNSVVRLLEDALIDSGYTLKERQQISEAVRSLDSVVGGYCNDRRR